MSSLFLLHGFTGAPSSFERVLAALPHPVPAAAAPLLTGHGAPPAAPEIQSFEAEVDRLAALALGPPPRVLVGYSLGARLALGLLVRHPERFERAVLISGSAGLRDETERAERRASDAEWRALLVREGLEAFITRWAALPLFATQAALSDEQRSAEGRRRASHTARGLAHSLAVTGLAEMPDYFPALGGVRVPVELLAGALDERFCAHAEAIVRELPTGRFTRVAGAGHNLLLERPESVAEAIERGVLP